MDYSKIWLKLAAKVLAIIAGGGCVIGLIYGLAHGNILEDAGGGIVLAVFYLWWIPVVFATFITILKAFGRQS